MDTITWLGHSTVAIRLGATRLITDPVLRHRVAHLRRQGDVPDAGAVDAILLSHLHRDHADLPTLRRFPAATPVIGPPGAARLLARAGRPVHEVVAGGVVRVGDVTVRAVSADHDGRRHPLGRAVPALGYIVEGRRPVYFAGDTGLFDAMSELGDVDVALLPVAGWGPRLGPGHMDPADAARAAALIRPRIAIPIHWGTYRPVGSEHRHGPLPAASGTAFAEALSAFAPEIRCAVLSPGERLDLPDPNP